jgi:dTDP-glucose 4,6-dehydratase
VYNIGGGNEVRNVDLTHTLLGLLGKDDSLIRRVEDRKGHDRRYSVSTAKLAGMGWKPLVPFEEGLKDTVDWYRQNEWWWRPVKERDPQYKAYMAQQYGGRPSH